MKNERPLLHRLGLALLTAAVPVLVMGLLLITQGYHWDEYAPTMGDEILYWHQAATWAQAGINGGYYVIDNATARAPFAHYYAWGFGPPVLYGTVAQVFGWPLYAVMMTNMLFVYAATAGFVLLTHLTPKQCLCLALLLAAYPPFVAYMPSSMLEPIYMALALLIAGGLYRLNQGDHNRWVILLTGCLLVVMGLMRFTWGFLFWPYLYYLPAPSSQASAVAFSRSSTSQRGLHTFAVTLLLVGLFFVVYNLTASPYLYALRLIIEMIPTEPVKGFLFYINMVAENTLRFLVPLPMHPPSLALRLTAVGLLVWVWRARARTRTRSQRDSMNLLLYILLNMFILALFAYTTVNTVGFRFISAYMLMALALCVAFQQTRVVQVVGLFFVLTIPLAFIDSDTNRPRAFEAGRAARIDAYHQEWMNMGVIYTPNVSPWCNTLAYSISYLEDPAHQDRLIALPSGLGLSMIWWKPQQTQEAQFLMLTQTDYQIYPRQDQLIHILDIPGGAVYRSTARECSSS